MKKYIAIVKDKETNRILVIESEYKTKKEFECDLYGNGYEIRMIETKEAFESKCK